MKVRADQLLVTRQLAPSRAKAQALILAGKVYVGESRVDKAGALLADLAAGAPALAGPRQVAGEPDSLSPHRRGGWGAMGIEGPHGRRVRSSRTSRRTRR